MNYLFLLSCPLQASSLLNAALTHALMGLSTHIVLVDKVIDEVTEEATNESLIVQLSNCQTMGANLSFYLDDLSKPDEVALNGSSSTVSSSIPHMHNIARLNQQQLQELIQQSTHCFS